MTDMVKNLNDGIEALNRNAESQAFYDAINNIGQGERLPLKTLFEKFCDVTFGNKSNG
ncbi:MAG: hypothetical protein J6R99_04140 [Alphaproteobacteria bacterium]|nr:hypothetical protein [Alphaproteobacteria bacterium]